MKKKNSVFFIFSLILAFCTFLSSVKLNKVAMADNIFNDMNSKSVYLADYNTKTVIFAKNEKQKAPIASMCKVMTLLLAFEAKDRGEIDFNEEIVVSQNASGMGGSQVFLECNAKYLVSELIKSIVVASANDACVAIAEKLCGSEEAFVDLMNKRASELGMENTCFVNCTGLPKDGQFSCAEDVFKMFSQLIGHKEYYKYSTIWLDEISHPEGRKTSISNTNKLIRFYNGCDAGKTGYTSQAGHCLTATASRNNMRLICVIISAPDSKTRFREASNLFNYGFANFTNKLIVDNCKPLDISVKVENGKKENLQISVESPVYIFCEKNQKRSFEINFTPDSKICAPISKGQVVGKVIVYENGIEIISVNAVSLEDVGEKTYFDIVYDITSNWGII